VRGDGESLHNARVRGAQIGSALRGYPRKTPPADLIGTLIGEDAFFIAPTPASFPHWLGVVRCGRRRERCR
jgi:hypothetical protein